MLFPFHVDTESDTAVIGFIGSKFRIFYQRLIKRIKHIEKGISGARKNDQVLLKMSAERAIKISVTG